MSVTAGTRAAFQIAHDDSILDVLKGPQDTQHRKKSKIIITFVPCIKYYLGSIEYASHTCNKEYGSACGPHTRELTVLLHAWSLRTFLLLADQQATI